MPVPHIKSFNGKFRDECLSEHWFGVSYSASSKAGSDGLNHCCKMGAQRRFGRKRVLGLWQETQATT